MSKSTDAELDRARVLQDIASSGRELSTAMILFHSRLSECVGLGPTEEKVLELILRSKTSTVGELAAQTGMAKNTISDLLDRLERKGFVTRSRHPSDGRKFTLAATEEGLSRFRQHFVELLAELDELYSEYSTRDLALMAEFQSRAAQIQMSAAQSMGKSEP